MLYLPKSSLATRRGQGSGTAGLGAHRAGLTAPYAVLGFQQEDEQQQRTVLKTGQTLSGLAGRSSSCVNSCYAYLTGVLAGEGRSSSGSLSSDNSLTADYGGSNLAVIDSTSICNAEGRRARAGKFGPVPAAALGRRLKRCIGAPGRIYAPRHPQSQPGWVEPARAAVHRSTFSWRNRSWWPPAAAASCRCCRKSATVALKALVTAVRSTGPEELNSAQALRLLWAPASPGRGRSRRCLDNKAMARDGLQYWS